MTGKHGKALTQALLPALPSLLGGELQPSSAALIGSPTLGSRPLALTLTLTLTLSLTLSLKPDAGSALPLSHSLS